MARPEMVRLTCPKCGSGWLDDRMIKEMYWFPEKPKTRPIFGGGNREVIYCAECNTRVWPFAVKKEEATNA